MAAALAYYAIFSIAPLLLIVIAIAGYIWGQKIAQVEALYQIRAFVGDQAASVVLNMIQSVRRPSATVLATSVSVVTSLVGASGAFGVLQTALNRIFQVKEPPKKGIGFVALNKLIPYAMVLAAGLLLILAIALNAALSATQQWVSGLFPGATFALRALNFLLAFALTVLLVLLLFRYVPEVKLAWRGLWVGAITTALLITVGQVAIAIYLGFSAARSVYGAAGALMALLLWIYYSAQVLFLGAVFTNVLARRGD